MTDLHSDFSAHSRFNGRAQDYAKYRPTYPQSAIDWILEGLGDTHKLRIADLGAGTGISSRLLAERGAQVVAIDPNPEMLTHAQRHTRVRFVRASAEETGLPGHSIDLITAFQAFHWFSRDVTMLEVSRVLKRCGRIAAVWNDRERAGPFAIAYQEFIETFGDDVATIDRGRHVASPEQTLTDAGFARVERRDFEHFHRMDAAAFIGYARSCSYLPVQGAQYDRLRAGLEEIYNRFRDAGGYVVFAQRTQAYRADRA
ncbi:MAG: methyltransferase domain-containing protein [Candidatus Eremiobacteraeota bacterium]|nr:methyltransferase domain-containing protein [Candidatus Eremiobacteraeota bacterium]